MARYSDKRLQATDTKANAAALQKKLMENRTDYEDEDKQLDSSAIQHAQELILCDPTPSLEPQQQPLATMSKANVFLMLVDVSSAVGTWGSEEISGGGRCG